MNESIKRLGYAISSVCRESNRLELDWYRVNPSISRKLTRIDYVLWGMLGAIEALGIDYDFEYRTVDNFEIADSITIAGQRFDIGI